MLYPDWPKSDADPIPLPPCDGPKLKPFDFEGPQQLEFLEHLGEGLHAHVFKVKIRQQIYALKLFRFCWPHDWLGPSPYVDENDREALSVFYDYGEPFSAECRAFGRLQETGYEDLAVKCSGYVLLDEEHERTMMDKFDFREREFSGNGDWPGVEDVRSWFVVQGGRPPPLRGIVKAFGRTDEDLCAKDARRILGEVKKMQQLGIIHIDVGLRQLVDGKLCDFSVAITVPHFITNPEMNPTLSPEWISRMEYESFLFSINEYWFFDMMVREWNEDEEYDSRRKKEISVFAFPGGLSCAPRRYDLRSTPSRQRVYSFVNPMLYDWKKFGGHARADSPEASGKRKSRRNTGCRAGPSHCGRVKKTTSRPRPMLYEKPPRWYLNGSKEQIQRLRWRVEFSATIDWDFKDGLLFPRDRKF